jgi:hypothetical protein
MITFDAPLKRGSGASFSRPSSLRRHEREQRCRAGYKHIPPLSQPTHELILLFGLIGWSERLLLHNGGPFVEPLGKAQKTNRNGHASALKRRSPSFPKGLGTWN